MKRGMLALAVMGALGSSVAFGQTYLCRTPSDMSFTACTPIEYQTVIEPAMVIYQDSGPAVVTYSEPAPAPRWIVQSADAPREVPEVSSVTITREYAREWPNTEPRVSRYTYSYGPWYYYSR